MFAPKNSEEGGNFSGGKIMFHSLHPSPCFWAELSVPYTGQPRGGRRKAGAGTELPSEKSPESPVLTAASQISWCPWRTPLPQEKLTWTWGASVGGVPPSSQTVLPAGHG